MRCSSINVLLTGLSLTDFLLLLVSEFLDLGAVMVLVLDFELVRWSWT